MGMLAGKRDSLRKNIFGVLSYMEKRSSFSSRVGFVLAAAGSAVGLGNIWRFPYLAAKYGGGIFLLVYILLVSLSLITVSSADG